MPKTKAVSSDTPIESAEEREKKLKEMAKKRSLKYQSQSSTDFKIRYPKGYFETNFDAIVEEYNLPIASLYKIALIEKFVRDGKSFPEGFDADAEIESIIKAGQKFLAVNYDRRRNGVGHDQEKLNTKY